MLSADESKTKSAIAEGMASDFWMNSERIGITQMSFVPPPAGNYILLPSIVVEFFVQEAPSTNFGIVFTIRMLFWVMFWFISDLARYDPEIPPSRLKSSQTSSYCFCLFVSTCPSYTAITIFNKRPHNGSFNQHETFNRKNDFLDNHPTSLSHSAYATCTSAISKSVTVDLRTNSAHESEISKVTYHTCLLLHRVL